MVAGSALVMFGNEDQPQMAIQSNAVYSTGIYTFSLQQYGLLSW